MTRKKKTVVATGMTYLDPVSCDSTIAYKIIGGGRRRYRYSTITLSDCNRTIYWQFGKDDQSIAKADKAIAILTEFRDKLVKEVHPTRKPKITRKRGGIVEADYGS